MTAARGLHHGLSSATEMQCTDMLLETLPTPSASHHLKPKVTTTTDTCLMSIMEETTILHLVNIYLNDRFVEDDGKTFRWFYKTPLFLCFFRAAGVSNSQASLYATNPHTVIPMTGIDPRFSAAYGNPYLRSSTTSLPPPHLNGGLATYGSVRSGPAPQVAPARTPPPSVVSPHSQYIVSNKAQLKPGTLATHV